MYEKELFFEGPSESEDFDLHFEYDFNVNQDCLYICNWSAYWPGTNVKVDLLDKEVSIQIEAFINKWLEKENQNDYLSDWELSFAETRREFMEDR